MMGLLHRLFVCFQLATIYTTLVTPSCVWRSQCGVHKDTRKPLNCKYDGPPETLADQAALDTLADFCPDLLDAETAASSDGLPRFCCTAGQVASMSAGLSTAGALFQRCPSCWRNFRSLFCHYTCSSRQSDYMRVIQTNETSNGVLEVGYTVSRKFAEGMFNSCRSVTYGNGKAIESFCTGKTAEDCRVEDMFNFLGSTKINPYAPFDTKFDLADQGCPAHGGKARRRRSDPEGDSFDSLDHAGNASAAVSGAPKYSASTCGIESPIVSCNAGFANVSACSCTDCPAVCAAQPGFDGIGDGAASSSPSGSASWSILGIRVWYVGLAVGYIVFLAVFAGSNLYFYAYSPPSTRKSSPRKVAVAANGSRRLVSDDDHLDGDAEAAVVADADVDATASNVNVNCRGNGVGMASPSSRECFLPHQVRVPMSMAEAAGEDAEGKSDESSAERICAGFDRRVESAFAAWGGAVAGHPVLVLTIGLLACLGLSCGIIRFQVTTDPVDLWSAPESAARQNKEYFDKHFGPFFRTEQVIIIPRNQSQFTLKPEDYEEAPAHSTYGPALRRDFLASVLQLQLELTNLTVPSTVAYGGNVTLSDICFKPLAPDFSTCAVQSPLGYFQASEALLRLVKRESLGDAGEELDGSVTHDWIKQAAGCVRNPMAPDCLSEWGGPIYPAVVFGGYPGNEYMNATAVVITFLVNNDPALRQKALDWEAGFMEVVRRQAKEHADLWDLRYRSERSIQDELERESHSDVLTILISYLVMFAYVTVTLGQYKTCSRLMIDLKVTLGLAGVLIVLLAVASSLGVWSFLGYPATLIIVEVVPFLVLAVGVDNIFILVQAYQRDYSGVADTVEARVARAVGRVGPSMLLSSASESVAFFFGALTPMPAVRVFALYAGMAVLIDFLLQISCFVALLTLDCRRQADARFDVLCCLSSKSQPMSSRPEDSAAAKIESRGFLFQLFKRRLSSVLFSRWCRPAVVLAFVTWAVVCLAKAPDIRVGLDQEISMPVDSYLADYFDGVRRYLSVGPPVYFVLTGGADFSRPGHANLVCSRSGCPQDSMLGRLALSASSPGHRKRSYLATPASSWLDDYTDWLTPTSGGKGGGALQCCRRRVAKPSQFCPSSAGVSPNCEACQVEFSGGGGSAGGKKWPTSESFYGHLEFFLSDNPGPSCAKGGHAAYASAVALAKSRISGNGSSADRVVGVSASHFMTYHTVLRTDEDFTNAYRAALALSEEINQHFRRELGHEPEFRVFPYSVFYVFYEQYLTIVRDTVTNLAICGAAIAGVTFVLLGLDFYATLIMMLTIALILNSMLGLMYFWDITMNAVSLVNLVMALGISVEFCSHLVRAFTVSEEPTRLLRARECFVHMGSSVFSGITLTKLGGIVVLGFAKSQLFRIFYFRMYLGIVLFGALHGLVFLPVLLSYVGPPLRKRRKSGSEVGSTTQAVVFVGEFPPNSKEVPDEV